MAGGRDDLWSGKRAEARRAVAPLAVRMRPRSIAEFVGQGHLLDEGKLLRRMLDARVVTRLLVHGPPGTGKTTLAGLIAQHTSRRMVRENAARVGVKRIREVVDEAPDDAGAHDGDTIADARTRVPQDIDRRLHVGREDGSFGRDIGRHTDSSVGRDGEAVLMRKKRKYYFARAVGVLNLAYSGVSILYRERKNALLKWCTHGLMLAGGNFSIQNKALCATTDTRVERLDFHIAAMSVNFGVFQRCTTGRLDPKRCRCGQAQRI